MAISESYLRACLQPGDIVYFYRIRPEKEKIRPWIAGSLGARHDKTGEIAATDLMYILAEGGVVNTVGAFDRDFEKNGEIALRANREDDGRIAEAEVWCNYQGHIKL